MGFWTKREEDYEEDYEELLNENEKLKKRILSLESLLDMRTKEKMTLANKVDPLMQKYSTVVEQLNHMKKKYALLENEYRLLEVEKEKIKELEQENMELVEQLTYVKTELADVVLDAKKKATQVIEDAKEEVLDLKIATDATRMKALSGLDDTLLGLKIAREKMNRTIEDVEQDVIRFNEDDH